MENGNIEYIASHEALVLYEKSTDHTSFSGNGKIPTSKEVAITLQGEKFEYAEWYEKNLTPMDYLAVINANKAAAPILDTKAKFIAGKGIFLYREKIENGKKGVEVVETPTEIKAFFKKIRVEDFLYRMAHDLCVFGNAFAQLVKTKSGDSIATIAHRDASTVRAGIMNEEGFSEKFIVCSDWKKPDFTENGNTLLFEGYIPDSPIKGKSCIVHIKDYAAGYAYYPPPSWAGLKDWLELDNLIPLWHISGLKNGYNIRYVIRVNERLFAGLDDAAALKKRKEKLRADLDACLSGKEGNGKPLILYEKDNDYKEQGLVKIEPITTQLNDKAFTDLFNSSNSATTSGFQIDPTLCGIETAGKLSSGSEKRIAYQIWLALHTPRPRKLILEPIEIVWERNGWGEKYPDLKIGIENVEITTLDQNPTGTQNTAV
jgi:hypothetical protein